MPAFRARLPSITFLYAEIMIMYWTSLWRFPSLDLRRGKTGHAPGRTRLGEPRCGSDLDIGSGHLPWLRCERGLRPKCTGHDAVAGIGRAGNATDLSALEDVRYEA